MINLVYLEFNYVIILGVLKLIFIVAYLLCVENSVCRIQSTSFWSQLHLHIMKI